MASVFDNQEVCPKGGVASNVYVLLVLLNEVWPLFLLIPIKRGVTFGLVSSSEVGVVNLSDVGVASDRFSHGMCSEGGVV